MGCKSIFPLDNTYLILITWDRYSTNERRAYLKSIINNKPTHYRNIYANFLHPKFDRWMSLFSQVKLPFADVILDIDIGKYHDSLVFYTRCVYDNFSSANVSITIYEQHLENDLKRLICLLKPRIINISTLKRNASIGLTIETYGFGEKLLEWVKFFMIVTSITRYVQDPDSQIYWNLKVIDGRIQAFEKFWLTLLKGGK